MYLQLILIATGISFTLLGAFVALKYGKTYLGLVLILVGGCLTLIIIIQNRVEPEICKCCNQIIRK